MKEFMVDGLLANVGIGIVLPFVLHLLRQVSLCSYALEPHLWHLVSQIDEFLDKVFLMTQVPNVDLQ